MQSLQRSGMEMMLLCSNSEWRRHGYECDVLATDPDIGPIAGEMRASGYGVYHIPFRSSWRYLPRASFIREFYKLCRANYDVVHIHTEMAPPVLALIAKLAGVRKVAVTPHNTFLFEGALRLRKKAERAFVRSLGGRYGMISDGVQACEWERFRNPGVRISNWIDVDHFRPPSTEERDARRKSLGISPEEFVVVSVANCNRAKNHTALLEAISQVAGFLKIVYIHVGREEEGLPERKFAAELGIEAKVRFLGSQGDSLSFLWAADLYAMPSLNEGLSIAALEAVAAASPVLFSDVPGLREIAEPLKSACLTPTDGDSIAEGLRLIASRGSSERLSRALIDSEIVRSQFSVRNGVRSIVQGLYQ